MINPIGVGDLVQVIRWPCCGHLLGFISTVSAIVPADIFGDACAFCHEHINVPNPMAVLSDKSAPVAWLRRYKPLQEQTFQFNLEEAHV